MIVYITGTKEEQFSRSHSPSLEKASTCSSNLLTTKSFERKPFKPLLNEFMIGKLGIETEYAHVLGLFLTTELCE